MTLTTTLTDDDRRIDFTVEVRYTCRPALSANPREVAVDVDGVTLDECIVWLGGYGREVRFAECDKARKAWAAEVERKFHDQIIEAILAAYWQGKGEAAA